MTLAEMLNQYNQVASEQQKLKLEELRRIFGSLDGFAVDGRPVNFNTAPPRWNSVAEMNAALKVKKAAIPSKPVVNKAVRLKEIEQELEIIRGRVPTPLGYKVDTSKVKALMTELRQLNENK